VIDRPAKLPPSALLVIWGARHLTLGEKVVWYHDWTLDQGGADAAYASHDSIAARLGGSLTPATVSKIRQRLKRLTLHEPLRRRDARNLGWVATLPRICHPHSYREVGAMAVALDRYLEGLEAWYDRGSGSPDSLGPTVQTEQTPQSSGRAAALGGRGATPFSGSQGEVQLPSVVKKRVAAFAAKPEKGDRLTAQELQDFYDSLDRDVARGVLTEDQAGRLRRVSGL